MNRHPQFFAGLIFVTVSLLTFVAGASSAIMVGQLTNSGLLGICGPYGEHADLVGCIFLGSFPVAVVAAYCAARFFYRRVTDGYKA
jgi:hypothetical protein